jgi:hypothetical protein
MELVKYMIANNISNVNKGALSYSNDNGSGTPDEALDWFSRDIRMLAEKLYEETIKKSPFKKKEVYPSSGYIGDIAGEQPTMFKYIYK